MCPAPRSLLAMLPTVLSTLLLALPAGLHCAPGVDGEDWPQSRYDARRSGNVPGRRVDTPLELVGAVPLSDAVFTSPAVRDGRAYVVDGSGVLSAIEVSTARVVWRFRSPGGELNVSNVSSPAVVGRYVHFGTTAGSYWVIDAARGDVVREIRCGEPIFASPLVTERGVYLVTLGSRVLALRPDGTERWRWDYVREVLGFEGDRWSGKDWAEQHGRVTWREQFLCTRDPASDGDSIVVPTGGTLVWLADEGSHARLRGIYLGPDQRESPCTLGLSVGADGAVYRQWTRRDNGGYVDAIRLESDGIAHAPVKGTETSYQGDGLLSFTSVSLRGQDVYRVLPQEGRGLRVHRADGSTRTLGAAASVAAPVLARDHAIVGGLDGALHFVPLSGDGPGWRFDVPSGSAITAPVAVADGRVIFGAEDGHLYILGPPRPAEAAASGGPAASSGGPAPAPPRDLELWRIRHPYSGPGDGPGEDWFTSFGDFANTNRKTQGIRAPFAIRWIRRFEGTVKHFSVTGGGRLYTHTAEGQVFAVEQETGRLLWRRYWPGVHVSYTSPLYHEGRLYVPQAGLERCRLRCLDAATGRDIWEAPFSGSPSWNRQMPPVAVDGLVVYPFSTGRYDAAGWLFEHQSTFGFPDDHRPLLRAWDAETGEVAWTLDFAGYGPGGDDAGLCLLDGLLYYSCYFGDRNTRAGRKVSGVTAAIEPRDGRIRWVTTDHAVHAGCTVSARDGRIYLGGYNPVHGKENRVWCLDARDGSLLWASDPLRRAIHVVTPGDRFLFTHAQYYNAYLLDPSCGEIRANVLQGYRCTRFTLSEPCLLGANLDVYDTTSGCELISSGPPVDVLLCVSPVPAGGRLFFTANGTGIQLSSVYGAEAEARPRPWRGR